MTPALLGADQTVTRFGWCSGRGVQWMLHLVGFSAEALGRLPFGNKEDHEQYGALMGLGLGRGLL